MLETDNILPPGFMCPVCPILNYSRYMFETRVQIWCRLICLMLNNIDLQIICIAVHPPRRENMFVLIYIVCCINIDMSK